MKKLKNIPTHYNFPGAPVFRDTTALPFKNGGNLDDPKYEEGAVYTWSGDLNSYYRFNITRNQWEYLNNDPVAARTIKYYYSCAGSDLDNKLYIFGGVSDVGHENNLILVDLADKLPVLSELSTTKNVPTARVGHGMEAHSGSLFIFGGKKYDGSQ